MREASRERKLCVVAPQIKAPKNKSIAESMTGRVPKYKVAGTPANTCETFSGGYLPALPLVQEGGRTNSLHH